MTLAQLSRLCVNPERWVDHLTTAMNSYWIDLPHRQQMFLATCLWESNGFLRLVEDLNYSRAGLLRWRSRFTPEEATVYANRPEAIGNHAYANRNGNGDEASGDGFRYRGGGLIQLTGRRNFARAEAATGFPFVAQPELLQTARAASEVAAWFWADAGCNEIADEDDFDGTQGVINRGSREKVADNMVARNDWLRKVRDALS